jgi:hypothetical protein
MQIERTNRAVAPVLAALTVVGLALRLYRLDTGLWYDEIITLITSVRLPLGEILTHFPGNNDHPLYSLMAYFAVALFGEASWSLRIPAALFGVASIPMLYLVGTKVTGRFESILAASILTVSYHHIWFSQNARGYTTLTFAVLLSTYLMLCWFEHRKTSYLIGYAVVAALGSYTHLTMVFVVVAHSLVCAFELFLRRRTRPEDWKRLSATFAGSGLLTLLVYAPMVPEMIVFFTTKTASSEEVATPVWAALEAVRGLQVGFGTVWVALAGGAIFGFGMWSFFRERPTALYLFLLPLPVTVGLAIAMSRPIFPRFLFFAIGFGLLIVVRGAGAAGTSLGSLTPLRVHPRIVGMCLASLFAAGAVGLSVRSLPYGFRYPKQDFVQAVEYVDQNAGASDVMAVVGETASTPVQRYLGRPWPRLESAGELEALRSIAEQVWVVYTFPAYIEAGQPELWATLSTDCDERRAFEGTVANGSVIVRTCTGVAP